MALAKNLASGTLAESISASTTTLLVYVGEGSASTIKGVWPNTPFYASIMPATPSAGVPNSLDSEIVKVTAVSNDQVGNTALTVIRAQRGTTGKAFTEGAIVTNADYADDAVLLSEDGTSETETPWINAGDIIWSSIIDKIYPVGSIFMSATLSTPEQVANALGGTWVAWGSGRVPVGVNTSDTDFNTVEKTGGNKTHTNTLGSHGAAGIRNFGTKTYVVVGADANSLWKMDGTTNSVWSWTHNADNNDNTDMGYAGVALYGRTEGGSSVQPYITCYMYKRTA